jgi:transcriptional regulator with XRE-family HTH domain
VAKPDQRQAFGTALSVALGARGWTQKRLGEALQDEDGRTLSQSAVSQWCSGQTEPGPATVFEIERHLRLAPGDLSQLLGYLPAEVDDRPAPSVIAAIQQDPALIAPLKRALLDTYKALVVASADDTR